MSLRISRLDLRSSGRWLVALLVLAVGFGGGLAVYHFSVGQ